MDSWRSPAILPIAALPSAASNSGRILNNATKPWWSDGTTWYDLTISSADGSFALLTGANFTGQSSVDSGGGVATTGYTLNISNSSQWFRFFPNIPAGSFNNIVQSGDHALIFSNNASGTGGMAIAPWGGGACMRMDAAGNFDFRATTHTWYIAGGATVLATLTSTGLSVPNTLAATGASAIINFDNRSGTARTYGWYATANIVRLFASGGVINDILTITEAGILTVGGFEMGYRNIPMTVKNAAYTFVNADKGKGIAHTDTTARAYTVPTGFAQGDILTVANETGTGACTIVPGTGMTMYLAGTATTGTRTLAVRGIASIYIGSGGTSCYVSGPGVT